MPIIRPEEQSITIRGYRVKPEKRSWFPFPADRMKAWPVDARVNSPKNNDPQIIVPIVLESVALPENLPQLL
jgi:putative SOS response-associated peptidase YedK